MKETIVKAKEAHMKAAKALMSAIRNAYPKDAVLTVKLGVATIRIKVTGHSDSWWSSPTAIYGYNVSTGKYRTFDPNNIIED